MFKKGQKKGFTIIELIVVMAVLAILVAMGAPRFLGYTKDAKATAMATDAGVIESAVMQYALQNDDAYPVAMVGEPGEEVADAVISTEIDNETYTLLGLDPEAGTFAGEFAAMGIVEIDGDAVAQFIRSTHNDLDSYALITAGDREGEVIAKTAQEKSDGSFVSGKLGI